MFGSVSEHYATLLQENQSKTCLSVQNVQFRGTELAKKIRYERIQSTPLETKRCLGAFRSMSQHFRT